MNSKAELSEEWGMPIPEVLDRATDALRRRQFLEGLADDFEAIRNDPEAWSQELAERAEWDAAMQAEAD